MGTEIAVAACTLWPFRCHGSHTNLGMTAIAVGGRQQRCSYSQGV
jgi:hypothetical protein